MKHPIRLLVIVFVVNVLLVAGAIKFFTPHVNADLKLYNVSIQNIDNSKPEIIKGKPSRFIAEKAKINIELADGVYDTSNHSWTLAGDKAQYALITPEANNSVGNTFIYGHNNPKVFYNLTKLEIGDKVEVVTQNKKVFGYTLKDIKEVEPTDVSLFEYRGPAILTVQTCSGSWYEKRKLFTFEFNQVKDI